DRHGKDIAWDEHIRGEKPKRNNGKFSGLVIENNGEIHDLDQGKINRDTYKAQMLHELEFIVEAIDNKDIHSPHVVNLVKEIKKMPQLNSKAAKVMWRKIYLITICVNGEATMIKKLFG